MGYSIVADKADREQVNYAIGNRQASQRASALPPHTGLVFFAQGVSQ